MSAAIARPRNNDDATSHRLADSAPSASTGPSDKPEYLSPQDFEMFVQDYAGRLLAVARRFLQREEDAADAVQDAFLSALIARHTFQGDSTVYTWLYRIVVNVCLMKVRSLPRAAVVSLDALLSTFDRNGCHLHSIADWSQQAECRLDREEVRAAVRSCIDQLPQDYRTILLLRDIDQLDTGQTAELLKLSRSAVKTRLHRARRALRTLLEPLLQ